MNRKRRNILKALIGLGLVLIGLFVVTTVIERIFGKKIFTNDEDEDYGYNNVLWIGEDVYGYDDRIETFLFVGTDASGNETGTGKDYRGTLADVLILMVIDHTDDTYGFLQIDRNTITTVSMIDQNGEDQGGSEEQICTAHWYGSNPEEGAENTVEAVKSVVGDIDDIDGYYVLNMDQLGVLNASVGGVEVTIEEDMTAVDPDFRKGKTIKLSNDQAEKYIRARMALEDDTNASRMRHQRAYMEGYSSKALKKLKEDPSFINDLWDSLQEVAVTDMKGKDVSRIAEALRSDESKGILSYQGETKLGHLLQDGKEHEEFYPSEESVVEVLTKLFSLKKVKEEE